MVKNVLIGLLFSLLLVAGFLIIQEGRVDQETDSAENGESILENLSDERAAEPPPTEVIEETEARTLLVGTWRSLDDSQSTIIFHYNGEITDSYGGGVLSETGNYQLFKDNTNLPIDTSESPGGMILRQTFGSEDYYYSIQELDTRSLDLVFLSGNGSTLRYERLSY